MQTAESTVGWNHIRHAELTGTLLVLLDGQESAYYSPLADIDRHDARERLFELIRRHVTSTLGL